MQIVKMDQYKYSNSIEETHETKDSFDFESAEEH